MNEGSLRLSFSSSYPNEFTSITASPFNWFEATYRYTEIKNRNYGPSFYSGNQTYKDKSFDVKIGIIMKLIIFQVLLLAFQVSFHIVLCEILFFYDLHVFHDQNLF